MADDTSGSVFAKGVWDKAIAEYQKNALSMEATQPIRGKLPTFQTPLVYSVGQLSSTLIINRARAGGIEMLSDPAVRMVSILLRLRIPGAIDMLKGSSVTMVMVPSLKDMTTSYDDVSGKVFVFLVSKGHPVVLEDDASLFPSDALITQLVVLKDVA